MLDGVIFDLDGTLWDAAEEIAGAWSRELLSLGVRQRPLTPEELRPCMGLELRDIAARLMPGLPLEERMAVMERCCRAENDFLARHGARLYPGAAETLSALALRCPLFVVSNCQDGYIQTFYQGAGLGKYFSDFECAGRTGLPKGENIRLVMARHGLKHPVYVGDTALDQAAARAAGIPFIHAAYGFGTAEGCPSIAGLGELPAALARLAEAG